MVDQAVLKEFLAKHKDKLIFATIVSLMAAKVQVDFDLVHCYGYTNEEKEHNAAKYMEVFKSIEPRLYAAFTDERRDLLLAETRDVGSNLTSELMVWYGDCKNGSSPAEKFDELHPKPAPTIVSKANQSEFKL